MRRDASPLGWLLALALAMALLAGYRVWMLGHLGIDLFFDESQYWFWSTELAWGYYSKPPAIALLIGWSTALLGNDLLGVKAPAIVLNALSPLLAFAIGARLAGARTGFLAALVVATLPIVAGLALFVTTDSPLIFFWLLGTWALLRAIAHDRWRDWLLLGASVGLGLLSKYTMVAFGLSAALALLVLPRGRMRLRSLRPWVAVLLALALFAPNVLWNAALGFPTFHHVAEITAEEASKGGWASLGEFAAAQWLLAGPVFGTVALLGWLRLRRLFGDEGLVVLTLAAVPLGLIGLVQAWRGGANANWAAPAVVVAALYAVVLLGRAGRLRLIVGGLLLNLVAGSLVLHWPDVLHAVGYGMTARQDPYRRMRGWSELMQPVQALAQARPGAMVVADDRELLSQIAYYVQPARFAAWFPGGRRPANHYQLTRPLPADWRGEVLLVHAHPRPDIVARFAGAQRLAVHVVPVQPGQERRIEVTLLTGFKGYR